MIWRFPYYRVGEPVDWDALERNLDWVRDMKNVPQDKQWHAEGDVLTHTKMVVEQLMKLSEFNDLNVQDKHILFTSALMHDIEKRSTTVKEVIDGEVRIISPKHAKKGELSAREILYTTFSVPFEIREHIVKLIRWHGLPIWAIQKDNSAWEVIRVSQFLNTKFLSLLAKADVLGRICVDKDTVLLQIELFNELCKENNCYGVERYFKTNYSRFFYLNRPLGSPDYIPYDNLEYEVIVMCALPGSGKDTYLAKNVDLPVLSLDALRRLHKIEPTDRKKNGRVIQMGKEKAKEYLRGKKSFVFNATNITSEMRKKWISLFLEYGARVKIIYLEVPYKQLLSQNHHRTFKVPEDVLHKMLNKLEVPTVEEAHHVVYHVVDGEV